MPKCTSIIIWTVSFIICIVVIAGCHYDGHDSSGGSAVDGTRKKRSTNTTNPNITVTTFFPPCIDYQLSSGNNSGNTTWKGPVSYIVYHSRWYRKVNQTCSGANDTAECWIHNLVNVVRGQSHTLRAAQDCVVEYYKAYHELEEYVITEFPNGTDFEDSSNCTTVDVSTYEQQFTAYLGGFTPEGDDDVAFTEEYLDDVLEFAQNDLYCPDCSCDDLAGTDAYFESFEFEGQSCGSCWYTAFATELSEDSDFWDEVSEITIKSGEFTSKNDCPVNYNQHFMTNYVVEDLLRLNVSCEVEEIEIDMLSCGLVQLGYRRDDEVFVADPNSPVSDIYTVDEGCVSKIKKGTNNQVTVIRYDKGDCGPTISNNGTHELYTYALRNRRPQDDPFLRDADIDRRVYIDFRFTCTYPTQGVAQLPFGISTLRRTISYSLENDEQLDVTMSAYRDADSMSAFLQNDANVTVPDPIWIKVSHNGGSGYIIDIPTCWIDLPGSGILTTNSLFLIFNGCPEKENNGTGGREGAFNVSTCSSNVASFMFYSFYLDDNTLSVNCDFQIFEETPPHCHSRTCGQTSGGTTDSDSDEIRRRLNMPATIALSLEPVIRECDEINKQRCDCDQICGCDSYGEPGCFCHQGYTYDEEKRKCMQ